MPGKGAAPIMTNAVEAIARAICRHSCSACGPGESCWDWEAVVPEARAALSALEKEGFKVFRITMRESEPGVFEDD